MFFTEVPNLQRITPSISGGVAVRCMHLLDEAATRQKSLTARLNLKGNLKASMRGIIQRRIMRLPGHDIIIGIKFQAELPNAS